MFASICDSTDISIPSSWTQNKISTGLTTVLQFGEWIVKKKDKDFKTASSKKVILDPSMNICILVMDKEIKVEDFGLETNVINSIQELENVIEIVHQRKICIGCAEINADENVLTSFTCRDQEGYLRHKSCPLLLSTEDVNDSEKVNNECKFCIRVRRTLNQKVVRIQKRKSLIKYLKLNNLSPERKKQIKYLQSKLQAETRAKKRAKQRIIVLKKEIESCREEFNNTDIGALEKILDKQKH